MQPLDPLNVPCEGMRLIEASAGTGKTYAISALYLRLVLEHGLTVRQILVVTYTVAATEELRDRLRTRLREALAVVDGAHTEDDLLRQQVERLADMAQAKRSLANAIACIDEAAIFTIHGFCQRMLQENAFESGTLFNAELLENEDDLVTAVVEDFWRRRVDRLPSGAVTLLESQKLDTPAALLARLRLFVFRSRVELRPILDPGDFDERAFTACHDEMARLWRAGRDEIVSLLESADLSRGPYKPEAVSAAAEAMEAYLGAVPALYSLPEGAHLFTSACLDANIKPARKAKGATAPTHAFFDVCERIAAMGVRWVMWLLREAMDYVRSERARRKAAHGLLSFDDLLTNLSAALEGADGKILAARIAARFPVALIDEFQDTDPEQYRIFASVYRGRADTALFMIGDPKQAIYSFRGADVFTYMSAKDDTDKAARYTLDTNWRSTASLLHAINTLYAHAHSPFIYDGHIDYRAVKPSGKAEKASLCVSGDVPAPLVVWHIPLLEENQHHGNVKASWLQEHLPEFCAEEIVKLLNLSTAGDAVIGDQPLRPRDIAVLVRDRHEAAAVQRALRARRINSAYYGRESVYLSEEADDLERVLLAIVEPADESVLRAALSSVIWGVSGTELARLQEDEEAWEQLVMRVQGYHKQWLTHGFLPMFRRWLHEQGVAPRLLRLEDGERRMTNLLQLGELLQAASREHRGIEQLVRWFAEQRADPDGDSEDQQLRLESDDDLVKIVTMHKSKGLEYPVVFLPFIGKARTLGEGPVIFHDPTAKAAVVDLAAAPESRAYAEKERLAEDLRLFYVALTRAKYLCYLAWGKIRDMERSALAWLLHGDKNDLTVEAFAERMKGLDEATLTARLHAWASESKGAVSVIPPPPLGTASYVPPKSTPVELASSRLSRAVPWQWRVTSYTALAGHAESERPDYGSTDEDRHERSLRPALRTIFDFPRGARAGTFMHQVLERLDFPQAHGDYLKQAVSRELERTGYGAEWAPAVEEMISNVLDAPLQDGIRLREITDKRKLVELEFHYPLNNVHASALDELFSGLGDYHPQGPALQFATVTGIMRGFMDLVFEHEGRYYIADYKSNYLGPQREDYGPDAVQAAVTANRYDLQYLIYTVALHRYLRRRVVDYDYDRHFGGVYYLFLRGMSPRYPEFGVYRARPDGRLLMALDALFSGRRP